MNLTNEQLNYTLSPKSIRDGAKKIYDLAARGETHFKVHPEKLEEASAYVFKVIKENYPDFNIPFHSRWGHFRAGGILRDQQLNERLKGQDPLEKARVKLDLVITSVLLDAGAGLQWSYFEETTQKTFSRSEGLGVASYYMFLSGIMSEDQSLKATSLGLKNIKNSDLEKYFQVGSQNPLVGVEGRVSLLKNLGQAVANKKIFKNGRPGNILDYLIENHLINKNEIKAESLLRAVLDGLGSIWPSRIIADVGSEKVNLGDVWKYKDQLISFHKLSQWMTYSLVEPIEEAGYKIVQVDQLTGLAEYRNGGLVLDIGLISCRDQKDLAKEWTPESEWIIEWRALTLYFLDLIAVKIQNQLNKTPDQFPLAKVLEGGTWWAGRKIAKEKRQDGGPPVKIKSDGTVF